MDSASGYRVEPELLQLKPRKITYRGGRAIAIGLGCFWLFLLPFVVVGIGTFASAVESTFIALFGRTVTGQVIERYYSDDSEGSGNWKIRYAYRYGGREYTGADDERGETALDQGMAVPVRIAPWLPRWGSFTVPPGASVWSASAFSWFFTLFWNAVLSIFLFIFFVIPVIYRSLFTRGEVAVGTIVDKSIQEGESKIYKLEYEYVPLTASLGNIVPQRDKENVTKDQWDSVEIGEKVTILYRANKPRRSVIYRFGLYQAQDR